MANLGKGKSIEILYEYLQARDDLVSFTILFLILLLGFIFFAWLSFGIDVEDFNGFVASLGVCWQFIIGNPPNYGGLYLSNRVLGPIVRLNLVLSKHVQFYALFTVFIFFILGTTFSFVVTDFEQYMEPKELQ